MSSTSTSTSYVSESFSNESYHEGDESESESSTGEIVPVIAPIPVENMNEHDVKSDNKSKSESSELDSVRRSDALCKTLEDPLTFEPFVC